VVEDRRGQPLFTRTNNRNHRYLVINFSEYGGILNYFSTFSAELIFIVFLPEIPKTWTDPHCSAHCCERSLVNREAERREKQD
jgi:hypothetical protein